MSDIEDEPDDNISHQYGAMERAIVTVSLLSTHKLMDI
jgi:hypothetical protein